MSPKKKVFDITLVPNNVLRPWTMDDQLDFKISEEVECLERTISQISPQKLAGLRGDSILDGLSAGLAEHEKTIRRPHNFGTTVIAESKPTSRQSSRASSVQFKQTFTEVSPRAESVRSRNDEEIADEQHIEDLQRTMHRRAVSSHSISKSPLATVRYIENKNPAILNVSHSEFVKLKLATAKA